MLPRGLGGCQARLEKALPPLVGEIGVLQGA
jgi:hypothetical protein